MVKVEYLNEYQPLPSFLLDAVDVSSRAASGMQRSGCIGDVTAEDCNQDGACTSDGGCSSDNPCSDCSDKPCSDCSDTQPVVKKRSIVSVSYTSTSATFTVTRNDATTIRLFVREGGTSDTSGKTVYDSDDVSVSSATWRHTVSGLSPGGTYSYNLKDDVGGWLTAKSFTTPFKKFNWTYAGETVNGVHVSGSTKTSGLGVYVTKDEWNEFAELVEDVTGSTVTRTTSGAQISAAIVNTAARALGVATVTKNVTEISAAFFNSLRTAYNSLAQT